MSTYKGQRGPNVSQYIANLNHLSPTQDVLAEPQPSEDDFSAFLNAEFFDATNSGQHPVDLNSPLDFDLDIPIAHTQIKADEKSPQLPLDPTTTPNMDFNMNSDFQFTDFTNFGQNHMLDAGMPNLPPSQPGHFPLPTNFASTPITQGFDHATKKRKADSIASLPQQSLDENVRVAAEEDKRRRNTAASARFRVKKKQREQALEKSAKDMSDKVTALEARVAQLETENTWLKGLITEKNGGKSTTSELRALISKHEEAAANGRSSSAHTDGVGTKAQAAKADA